MRRSSMRVSASPQSPVNLYCLECETQIGIFENEWIRLTSSYARSKNKGKYFGIDIGNRTQVVQSGGARNKLAGCELSDVFCQQCSQTVGQFCRTAPDESKQHLVGTQFYKLSKIFLKDSQTMQVIEPEFGLGDDYQPQGSGSRRYSQTPLPKVPTFSRPQSAARQSVQPRDGFADRISPELGGSISRRSTFSRHSIQPNRLATQTPDGSSFPPPYHNMQTSTRYSMPPEASAASGPAEHLFTPQPTYFSTVPQSHLYASPYPQTPSRSGTLPPQPTYVQPVYVQIPFPQQQYPAAYPQTQTDHESQIVQPPQELELEDTLQVAVKPLDGRDAGEENQALEESTKHESKMDKRDVKIFKLEQKFEELLGEVQKVQVSLEDMRRDMGLQRVSRDAPADFVNNFETMVRAVRALKSSQSEMEDLRAQNYSMKTRLDSISSAINPLQTSVLIVRDQGPLDRQPISPSSLGKRKRDQSNDGRRSDLQRRDDMSDSGSSNLLVADGNSRASERVHGIFEDPDSIPTPPDNAFTTPLSSVGETSIQQSELFTQGESFSTDTTEEQSQVEDSLLAAEPRDGAKQKPDSEEELSHLEDSLLLTGASRDMQPAIHTRTTPQANTSTSGSQMSSTDHIDDAGDLCPVIQSEKRPQDLLMIQPVMPDEGPMISLDDGSDFVNNIDFSDDEPARSEKPAGEEQTVPTGPVAILEAPLIKLLAAQHPVEQDDRPSTSELTASQQAENPLRDVQSKVSNSKHKQLTISTKGRPKGRRATDGDMEHEARSMAPEPIKRRRTTTVRAPRVIDLEDAYVATPAMIAERIQNRGKPRVPKPKVQTTEKVLNKELKALGLSEWIGKDKNNPVYKQAVDAARKQDREAKRLQKLSEKGLNIVKEDARSTSQPSTMQEQAVVNGAGRPVLEVSNTNLQPPAPTKSVLPEPVSSSAVGLAKDRIPSTSAVENSSNGVQTRRQQRAEQRAQQTAERLRMAEEAMEREEMGLVI